MERIVPHLWFDTEAKEAAEFYVSLFPGSNIESTVILSDTPTGDSEVVSFDLSGQPFMALSGGPMFTFNQSISFILNFDPSKGDDARGRLMTTWNELSRDGQIRMPLQKYDFSELYGWMTDRYGLSWQIVPTAMREMLSKGTSDQINRVMQAVLPMKKLDIDALERAHRGG